MIDTYFADEEMQPDTVGDLIKRRFPNRAARRDQQLYCRATKTIVRSLSAARDEAETFEEWYATDWPALRRYAFDLPEDRALAQLGAYVPGLGPKGERMLRAAWQEELTAYRARVRISGRRIGANLNLFGIKRNLERALQGIEALINQDNETV